jgi:hypothetical protein
MISHLNFPFKIIALNNSCDIFDTYVKLVPCKIAWNIVIWLCYANCLKTSCFRPHKKNLISVVFDGLSTLSRTFFSLKYTCLLFSKCCLKVICVTLILDITCYRLSFVLIFKQCFSPQFGWPSKVFFQQVYIVPLWYSDYGYALK